MVGVPDIQIEDAKLAGEARHDLCPQLLAYILKRIPMDTPIAKRGSARYA